MNDLALALPLSIRSVKPHPDAMLIHATRWDGVPDGVHTGGAYHWRDRHEVYKPLDGRPYMNADAHYPTQERECLEAFAGQPFFPRNWRVERLNGRDWLVRPWATILQPTDLSLDVLRALWQQVQVVNAAGWELADLLSIGEVRGELFIVDCSCAHRQTGPGAWWADDKWRVAKLWRAAGYGDAWEQLEREVYLASLQERYPDEYAQLDPELLGGPVEDVFFELHRARKAARVLAE